MQTETQSIPLVSVETAATPQPRNPNRQKNFKKQSGGKAKASSKRDMVLAMLRAPSGTTIAAIMKSTKWQQHSVHGFLSGVVRKKLRLNLASKLNTDGDRVYRVIGGSVRGGAGKTGRKVS